MSIEEARRQYGEWLNSSEDTADRRKRLHALKTALELMSAPNVKALPPSHLDRFDQLVRGFYHGDFE